MNEQVLFSDEKHFHQFADFMPQLVWTARPDGYVDYFNKQWYNFTGFEEGQGDQSWIPILHPNDAQLCVDTWYNSVRTGNGYEIEYRFKDRKKPGSYRWFLGRACPIKDEEGRIIKWIGTCTDIDDQKRQEEVLEQRVRERTESLDRLNLELNRTNQNLQQFAYVASHDLQEPLRKIQSFGDILVNQFGAEIGNAGNDIVQRMQKAATRMSGLIRDLLMYSRLTDHRDSFEPVRLDEVISEVTDDLEMVIEKAEAVVLLDPLPLVRGNSLQMRQLFQNLLSNALKFRRTDVQPEIKLSSRKVDAQELPADLAVPVRHTSGHAPESHTALLGDQRV